jgi:hypothetical protein
MQYVLIGLGVIMGIWILARIGIELYWRYGPVPPELKRFSEEIRHLQDQDSGANH